MTKPFLKLLFIGIASFLASSSIAQVKHVIYLNIYQPNVEECTTDIQNTFRVGEFKVFPNPSEGSFTLEINNLSVEEKIDLIVYDISGKRLIKERLRVIGNVRKIIDLSGYNSGTYFLNILGEQNAIYKAKLIIY